MGEGEETVPGYRELLGTTKARDKLKKIVKGYKSHLLVLNTYTGTLKKKLNKFILFSETRAACVTFYNTLSSFGRKGDFA